jgi:hypothetical protein
MLETKKGWRDGQERFILAGSTAGLGSGPGGMQIGSDSHTHDRSISLAIRTDEHTIALTDR